MQAWVIGNWKQNPATMDDVEALLTHLLTAIDAKKQPDGTSLYTGCRMMVAPSCVHLATVSARLQGSSVLCAAQNVSAHSASTGAYTGDCSAKQVADTGATWTILGHSERRQYHQESYECLLKKASHALTQDLGVVYCIGETQEQYDNGDTLEVLSEQLSVIQALLTQSSDILLADRLIIAYEPVWAIGTGKVPTVQEVSNTHRYIKQTVASFVNGLDAVTVLYGGSVNADNAESFAADSMIDGALVGGASLKAESFLPIVDAFGRASA